MKNNIFLHEVLNKLKSIICLNGDISNVNTILNNKIFIAADGGADKMKSFGISPDIIVGDFDSIKDEKYKSIKIINKDENFTDFEKVIMYLKEKNLFPTLALGVNGGDIDRILHNIMITYTHNIPFYSPPILGHFLTEQHSFTLDVGTKLSIFGQGALSTTGLKWNLNQAHFNFPEFASCSNRVENDVITFDILDGKFLLLIYIPNVHHFAKP